MLCIIKIPEMALIGDKKYFCPISPELLPIDDSRDFTDPPLHFLLETHPVPSDFDVSFVVEAIPIFKRLAHAIETHDIFRERVEDSPELQILELDRIFERKLAMYISLKIGDRTGYKYAGLQVVTEEDILTEICNMLQDVLQHGYNTFPPEHSLEWMLNGYPLSLLMSICKSNRRCAHIIGESVRRFVKARKTHPSWMPMELSNITSGYTALVGDSAAPMNELELDALFRYVGSQRQVYIHILLNALAEITEHERILLQPKLTEDDIVTICKSSWLYLCLFAIQQNASIQTPTQSLQPSELTRSSSNLELVLRSTNSESDEIMREIEAKLDAMHPTT